MHLDFPPFSLSAYIHYTVASLLAYIHADFTFSLHAGNLRDLAYTRLQWPEFKVYFNLLNSDYLGIYRILLTSYT